MRDIVFLFECSLLEGMFVSLNCFNYAYFYQKGFFSLDSVMVIFTVIMIIFNIIITIVISKKLFECYV